MTRMIRVFPRRTRATPVDTQAYTGPPDLFAEADEVHISVSFTWDRDRAERLADQWRAVAPVRIGGVAYGDDSLEFIPGRYVRPGYTITSRGCPRRCWFCGVWKKWPQPNLLTIYDGWNILDDNLLACPREHVEAVFAMLRRQEKQDWPGWDGRVEFTGGLEALALEDYQVGLLADMTPRPNMFFAYDPGDEFGTLESAARRLIEAGFTARSHRLRCYCLVGHPKDSLVLAEQRMTDLLQIGFTPFAMLWRPEHANAEKHAPGPEWSAWRRRWIRPGIMHAGHPEAPQRSYHPVLPLQDAVA